MGRVPFQIFTGINPTKGVSKRSSILGSTERDPNVGVEDGLTMVKHAFGSFVSSGKKKNYLTT
jgi:hypothetical protein